MNALHEEGFVALGGPLEGTRDFLLIIGASDADEIASRLESDPWSGKDLLRITQVAPWTLRLGSLETKLCRRPERPPQAGSLPH